MDGLLIFLGALVSVGVSVVVALVAVGSTTATLARRVARVRYDVDDAVEFIAASLPDDVTARVSFDDVRAVVDAQLGYLAHLGLASSTSDVDVGDELRVVSDDDVTAWVLGVLDDAGREVADVDVVAVLTAEAAYRQAIGAAGRPVEG